MAVPDQKIVATKTPNEQYGIPWWDAKGEAMVATKRWPFAKTVKVQVAGFPSKRTALAAVRRALAAIAIVLSLGCRGLAPTTPTAPLPGETEDQAEVRVCIESCKVYDDGYLVYYALGMTFSGTSAAAGAGGILASTLADEPGADIGLACTAAAAGIGAVVFNWLAGESAERYTQCKATCQGGE